MVQHALPASRLRPLPWPRPAHSLVPGRDSAVRKMVKPKATRCAKIPRPLRSQRVSLGSLAGAGTRPTSRGCMAMLGRPAQSSCQSRLPGLQTRRRWRRLQERLLPGDAAGSAAEAPTAPSGGWGRSASTHRVRSPETPTGQLAAQLLCSYVYKTLSLYLCLQAPISQAAYGNYLCGN